MLEVGKRAMANERFLFRGDEMRVLNESIQQVWRRNLRWRRHMSDFIIVVEVCNKRALAAYTKGLEGLNLIWPQLAVHAARMDLKADEQYRILDEYAKKARAEAKLHSRDLDYDYLT